jgi:hypothetical protein
MPAVLQPASYRQVDADQQLDAFQPDRRILGLVRRVPFQPAYEPTFGGGFDDEVQPMPGTQW